VSELREASYRVALAVGRQAQAEGLAQKTSGVQLRERMWTPLYRAYKRIVDA
jgi:hypothetical protein